MKHFVTPFLMILLLAGCHFDSNITVTSINDVDSKNESVSQAEEPQQPHSTFLQTTQDIDSDIISAFQQNKKYGLVNHNTWEILVEPIYVSIGNLSDGLILAELKDQFHYIDENGNVEVVVDKEYDNMHAGPFVEGIAEVYMYSVTVEENLLHLNINADKTGRYFESIFGLIDKSGEYILPIQYIQDAYSHKWNDRGTMIVRDITDDALWGVINRQGQFVVEPVYDHIDTSDYEYGIMRARMGDKWGYINQYGEIVIDPQYAMVDSFRRSSDDTALVYDVYIFAVDMQVLDRYIDKGHDSMYVAYTKRIDIAGNVVSDNNYLYVEKKDYDGEGITMTKENYILAQEGDVGEDLVEISFANMAIVNIGHYINIFYNAERDEDGHWYLTYEYPSIWAVLVDEQDIDTT